MKKKAQARGRKSTGRNVAIYPRVNPVNSQWVEKVSTKVGKSQAEVVDTLLTFVRKHYALGEMKEQIFGSEA